MGSDEAPDHFATVDVDSERRVTALLACLFLLLLLLQDVDHICQASRLDQVD